MLIRLTGTPVLTGAFLCPLLWLCVCVKERECERPLKLKPSLIKLVQVVPLHWSGLYIGWGETVELKTLHRSTMQIICALNAPLLHYAGVLPRCGPRAPSVQSLNAGALTLQLLVHSVILPDLVNFWRIMPPLLHPRYVLPLVNYIVNWNCINFWVFLIIQTTVYTVLTLYRSW